MRDFGIRIFFGYVEQKIKKESGRVVPGNVFLNNPSKGHIIILKYLFVHVFLERNYHYIIPMKKKILSCITEMEESEFIIVYSDRIEQVPCKISINVLIGKSRSDRN